MTSKKGTRLRRNLSQLRAMLTLETTRTFFIDTVPQISARQTFDKRLE